MVVTSTVLDCAIIGAGVSGLVAARRLSEAGLATRVFEKSRGIGGRVASRRIEGAPFDHGGQFLTRRSEEFSEFVDELVGDQVAFPWFGDKGKERFAGLPSMNQIAKNLAKGIDVERGTRVDEARLEEKSWRVSWGFESVRAKSLLLTCPAPQALEILKFEANRGCPEFLRTLRTIGYDKGIALMALLQEPFAVSESGFLQFDDPEPIATVADTLKKRGSESPGIVIQSGPEFAERHFDSDPEKIAQALLDAYPRSKEFKVVSTSLQKWRFAKRRQHGISDSFSRDLRRKVWHAGDGYVSPKIEGAYLSGLRVAEEIVVELGLEQE